MGYSPKYSEAFMAAKWWVDQLRNGAPLDMGDDYQSAIATVMARNIKVPPEVLNQFEEALADSMVEYLNSHVWNDAAPMEGADDRRITVNIDPPTVLSDPWRKVTGSQPPQLYFPVKTIMWINPGSITVQHGYHGVETEVWNKNAPTNAV